MNSLPPFELKAKSFYVGYDFWKNQVSVRAMQISMMGWTQRHQIARIVITTVVVKMVHGYYPLLVTANALLFMPQKANSSVAVIAPISVLFPTTKIGVGTCVRARNFRGRLLNCERFLTDRTLS